MIVCHVVHRSVRVGVHTESALISSGCPGATCSLLKKK